MSVFGPKWAIFDSFCPGKAKTGFFGKKRKCHFRKLIMPQLCARNQNKPMNGFWDLKCTDTWTNGHTDGGEFKGTKKYLTKNISYKKLHLKRFRVNIRSKHKRIRFFLSKMVVLGPKKGPILNIVLIWNNSKILMSWVWKMGQNDIFWGQNRQIWVKRAKNGWKSFLSKLSLGNSSTRL